MYRGQSNSWPGTKNTEFWSSGATFIASTVKTQKTVPRTGMCTIYWIGNVVYFVIIIGSTCRNKVLKTSRKDSSLQRKLKDAIIHRRLPLLSSRYLLLILMWLLVKYVVLLAYFHLIQCQIMTNSSL